MQMIFYVLALLLINAKLLNYYAKTNVLKTRFVSITN